MKRSLSRAHSEDSRALLETLLAVGHLAIYREEWDQAEAPLREALGARARVRRTR